MAFRVQNGFLRDPDNAPSDEALGPLVVTNSPVGEAPFIKPLFLPESAILATGHTPVANRMIMSRVIIPRTGTIRDLAVAVTTTDAVGGFILFIYDTGQATSGERTLLWDSGELELPANNTFDIVADPQLEVEAGQQIEMGWMCETTTPRILGVTVGVSYTVAPDSALIGGVADNQLVSRVDASSFEAPATIDLGDVDASLQVPWMWFRIE